MTTAEDWMKRDAAARLDLATKLRTTFRQAADLATNDAERRALLTTQRNLGAWVASLVVQTTPKPCCEDAQVFGSCMCATLESGRATP